MCECYFAYSYAQLEHYVDYFDIKHHAKKGFLKKNELVYARHPHCVSASSLQSKVAVSDNRKTCSPDIPTSGQFKKYPKYFYRYDVDNIQKKVMPLQVLL